MSWLAARIPSPHPSLSQPIGLNYTPQTMTVTSGTSTTPQTMRRNVGQSTQTVTATSPLPEFHQLAHVAYSSHQLGAVDGYHQPP
eukprot:3630949-Amphidinium_carterae.1